MSETAEPTPSAPAAAAGVPQQRGSGTGAGPEPADPSAVPQPAPGIALHGRYEGAGYADPRYLIARSDGQMVLVSELLYRVAEAVDGERDLAAVAERVSARGPHQISAPGVEYLINEKLHGLGIASLTGTGDAPRADPLLSLALRGVLLPARVVRPIAAVLAPLFHPVVVVAVLCALVATDVVLVTSGALDPAFHRTVGAPAQVLAVLGLMMASTLFHETGHAAACRYGGGRPGAIGFGVMLIVPALFTNVTDAYRLDRAGRLRTDLGGLYFNALFILGAAAAFWATHAAPLVVFIVLSHMQMLQQLLPLVRMDGYYILGDLVGVPNLFAYVKPMLRRVTRRHGLQPAAHAGLRPRVRILVTAWVAVVVPTLSFAVVMLLLRLPAYFGTALTRGGTYWWAAVEHFEHGAVLAGLLGIASLVIVLLPWLGGTALVVRLVRRSVRALRKRRPRRTARHRAASGRARVKAP